MQGNIINIIEQEQIRFDVPNFRPGDVVEVNTWITEGDKRRLQSFKGLVIAIRHRSIHSSFTVRKFANKESIERTFPTYSPIISSIVIKRRGSVHKAKLYYLRKYIGKSIRIKERLKKNY